jgi:DNA-binding NtrC family response regulator
VKARVAVLDDEARMADVIAMVLRRERHHVEPFRDGTAALAALREQPFDLLLTDLRMPAPDGLAVLREALAIDRELPVILLTAHGSVSSAIEAIRHGAFDYVEKPFDNDEL